MTDTNNNNYHSNFFWVILYVIIAAIISIIIFIIIFFFMKNKIIQIRRKFNLYGEKRKLKYIIKKNSEKDKIENSCKSITYENKALANNSGINIFSRKLVKIQDKLIINNDLFIFPKKFIVKKNSDNHLASLETTKNSKLILKNTNINKKLKLVENLNSDRKDNNKSKKIEEEQEEFEKCKTIKLCEEILNKSI